MKVLGLVARQAASFAAELLFDCAVYEMVARTLSRRDGYVFVQHVCGVVTLGL